jgi:hypothetical protein
MLVVLEVDGGGWFKVSFNAWRAILAVKNLTVSHLLGHALGYGKVTATYPPQIAPRGHLAAAY